MLCPNHTWYPFSSGWRGFVTVHGPPLQRRCILSMVCRENGIETLATNMVVLGARRMRADVIPAFANADSSKNFADSVPLKPKT